MIPRIGSSGRYETYASTLPVEAGGNRCHREISLRLTSDEAVLFDQVAGKLGETIPFIVAVKDPAEHMAPKAKGDRGSAARSMLQAELHHAAQLQAIQTEVGKVSGGSKDGEHLHGGLQFRIGHQWQIDQALDRAPIESLPDRFEFRLDMLPCRVRWNVNAEQAQARERAVDGLREFALQ